MIPIPLLFVGAAATVVLTCGAAGLLYVVLYVAAAAPGLPLGWALFGRRHGAGWIAGALFGYGVAQLALWLPIAVGVPFAPMFVLTWAVAGAAIAATGFAIPGPLVVVGDWTGPDTRGLVIAMLLAAGLMLAPYRNIGAADAQGTRYYRAYFTADFFWHTALAGELGKYSMPPRNPYLAPQPMHYYWTYFLLPAVAAREGPPPLRDVQNALKANAICSAMLVFGAMWLLARAAVPRAGPATAAMTLGAVAASAEGVWVLRQLAQAGRPLADLRDMNIDAITAWQFNGLRIDCLPRSIWYNPQHSMACALGLVAALVATRGIPRSRTAALLAGLALGLSTMFNPFIGGVFSLIYGGSLAWHAAAGGGPVRHLLNHALAAIPVAGALVWCIANGTVGGAAAAVTFGIRGFARNHPLATLMLSTGPILIPAVAGLWKAPGCRPEGARVAIVGCVLSLLMLYGLTLSERSWVGFRAGQILLLLLPVLLARAFVIVSMAGSRLEWALAALILAAGLPTTIIDVYNTQDVSNRNEGPGFPWTLTVTRAQQDAFAWLQKATPRESIVQMEPIVRGRGHWSLIPTFAQRRMAAGLPISLLPSPEYLERSERVRGIFATPDSQAAWADARRLRIDYLYVDNLDRQTYGAGIAKLNDRQYFLELFHNAEVSVFQVR